MDNAEKQQLIAERLRALERERYGHELNASNARAVIASDVVAQAAKAEAQATLEQAIAAITVIDVLTANLSAELAALPE